MEQPTDKIYFRLPHTAYDVVAIAASAGGLQALQVVLSGLPGTFPAAIVIVQHMDPHRPSLLAPILARQTGKLVKQAMEGDKLQEGTVFIAPPDRHLLVRADGTLMLSGANPVHFVRPAADLMLASIAANFPDRCIAVILSGSGTDGAAGVEAIKAAGGKVIVQSEATCLAFGMPSAAIHTGCVDYILPLEDISTALCGLVITGEQQ